MVAPAVCDGSALKRKAAKPGHQQSRVALHYESAFDMDVYNVDKGGVGL